MYFFLYNRGSIKYNKQLQPGCKKKTHRNLSIENKGALHIGMLQELWDEEHSYNAYKLWHVKAYERGYHPGKIYQRTSKVYDFSRKTLK